MKEFYTAPNAEMVKFQTLERLAAEGDEFLQGTGEYDNVVDFDDLLKPKGW